MTFEEIEAEMKVVVTKFQRELEDLSKRSGATFEVESDDLGILVPSPTGFISQTKLTARIFRAGGHIDIVAYPSAPQK